MPNLILQNDEELLTIAEAARYLGGKTRREKPISPVVIWRYCTKGKHGVLLESVLIVNKYYTSREALNRFFAEITDLRKLRLVERTNETQCIADQLTGPRKRRNEAERAKAVAEAKLKLAS